MSLFALPVTVSDLTQLQEGIEFFTDVSEATNEAAMINAVPSQDTVANYANKLLARNISLSEVAMAVDSLMFGVTDSIGELTKLTTQFLPAQVAVAIASGFNPTVYAAEALGLALAGGNGTSNAFATEFGSLSVSQFALAVASLTGINSGAIEGFALNWIKFYTANPSATFGLSVTVAAYGAAFGDTVGAALLNPTVNASLALLDSEVQNALIDNAEGLYKVGIPLNAEPPHTPLQQGEAFPIPNAGGAPYGATIDWATLVGSASDYAQFVAPAQSGPLTIDSAPSIFTLDTQHYGTNSIEIDAAHENGSNLFLILGDSTAGEAIGGVTINGYSTVTIVANGQAPVFPTNVLTSLLDNTGVPGSAQLVISGSNGSLELGLGPGAHEGLVSVDVGSGTITDYGVNLELGVTNARLIDASNAPSLFMALPESFGGPGVTVLGGSGANILQGSLGGVNTVKFTNGTTGLSAAFVGADDITSGGSTDKIAGDGGPDTITLSPSHSVDTVVFGADFEGKHPNVLAITDGSDVAYPGFWGASQPTAIHFLFSGPTGGTLADMTTVTGFHAGSGGDVLDFATKAWNGASTISSVAANHGDLVALFIDQPVLAGAAQLSAVWANSGSNSSLTNSDDVLLYAPSDASLQNAQQLAARLHTSADAVTLPGGSFLDNGLDAHILVAYDASFTANGITHPVVNIADVDLVNASGFDQNSTANLNVYASDMVHLLGVSLTSLTSANIQFF